MMKKKSIFIGAALFFILLVSGISYLVNLLSPIETFMAKIAFRDRLIEIRFIQAGATTRDVIQITSTSKKYHKKILKNIENNNFLVGYSIINDSTLRIVVNKVGRFVNKPDTLDVIVP